MILNDLSPQQKAVKLLWLLAVGNQYSTREIADMFQMDFSGAWRMMYRIKEILPALQEPETGGKWKLNIEDISQV